MSDGDEDTEADADEAPAPATDHDLDVETFEERLDAVEADLEDADTEAELDEVETTLAAIEGDLAAADLPEPDEEDEESPTETVEARIEDLRARLEEKRGPYAADVVEIVETAQSTIRETRWTEDGEAALRSAVSTFVERVGETLDAGIEVDAASPETLADSLDRVVEVIEAADLDPDEDAETIGTLLDAAEDLEAAVENAESWDDLSVREKLRAEGFYEPLDRYHKDFPPEWTALKQWELRDNVEMVLLALDHLGSEFMERHCLESLERMGNPGATEEMLGRAERRDKPAIRILGRIGSEDALDTLHEFVDGDPGLQRTTLGALGQIGSEESTQPVANLLVSEEQSVRSRAARTLGLIGDPRAVDPLTDVLDDEEEATPVRASAAWALARIGTEEALEAAAEHTDDRSYIVQAEAEDAAAALDADGERREGDAAASA